MSDEEYHIRMFISYIHGWTTYNLLIGYYTDINREFFIMIQMVIISVLWVQVVCHHFVTSISGCHRTNVIFENDTKTDEHFPPAVLISISHELKWWGRVGVGVEGSMSRYILCKKGMGIFNSKLQFLSFGITLGVHPQNLMRECVVNTG